MTYEEKRLNILNKLLIIKILRKENKEASSKIYFKFRKLHPIILILLAWKVICYLFKSSIDFIKDLIDELNEEDFIEIKNEN